MSHTVGPITLPGLGFGVLGQYDPRDLWNGWLCPSIDAATVVQVLDAINGWPVDGLTEVYAYEWTDDGELQLVDRVQEQDDDAYEPEVISRDADGLYALGYRAWVWEEVT